MPEKMAADHVDLMTMLDQVRDEKELETVVTIFDKLNKEMREHLAEEESIIPSALRDNFSQ